MKKQILLRLLLVLPLLSSMVSLAYAPSTHAACDPNARFLLTIPAWYRGLVDGSDCNIKDPNSVGGLGPFVQIIALNIVEIMLNIVAYVTIAFIIIGGFKYITSAGSPDANEKGRKTIVNAVIGLLISIASIGIVNAVVSNAVGNGNASGTTSTSQGTQT